MDMEQEQLDQALYKALFDKDFNLAEDLIEQGADIEWRNDSGKTMFMIFTLKTGFHADTALWLRDKGADVSAFDNERNTVLNKFLIEYNISRVEWLLKNNVKVDPNIENNMGMTPLIASMSYDKHTCFDLVMKFNPDINQINVKGNTALYTACSRYKSDDDACKLIDMGADCSVVDDRKQNMLHLACFYGLSKVVDKLIEKKPDLINARNVYGETPMALAPIKYNFRAISKLYEAGADHNVVSQSRSEAGIYPLMSLIKIKKPLEEKAKKALAGLMSGNSDPEAIKQVQEAQEDMTIVNETLEKMKVDPKTRFDIKNTHGEGLVFYFLGSQFNEDDFLFFLDKGMNIDLENKEGVHSVFYLSQNIEDIEVFKKVVDSIQDKELWENKKRIPVGEKKQKVLMSPSNLLTSMNDLEKLTYLKDSGVSLEGNLEYLSCSVSQSKQMEIQEQSEDDNDFQSKMKKAREEAVKLAQPMIDLFLSAGDDINWTNKKGESLIMLKAKKDENLTLSLFIENGADLTYKNAEDRDILLDSVVSVYPDSSFELIRKKYQDKIGIPDDFLIQCILDSPEDQRRPAFIKRFNSVINENNINSLDESNNSPLIIAAATEQLDIVNTLLKSEMGCDVNHKNDAGEVALIHAAGLENFGIVKELVEYGADKNIEYSSGQTVEDVIKENCSESMLEAIKKGEEAYQERLGYTPEKEPDSNRKMGMK